jgi:hypothetical protein
MGRDFDPAIGRYVESDPLGLKAGIDPYLYVSADPLGASDPLGLLTISFNCTSNKGRTKAIKAAERQLRSLLTKESCPPCNGKPESCVPCQYRDRLLQQLDATTVSCESLSDCGSGQINGSIVRVGPNSFTKGCDCLASTLLHELLHNIGLSHGDTPDRIPAIEQACMGALCRGR